MTRKCIQARRFRHAQATPGRDEVKYYSVAEVAQIVALSEKSVRGAISRGELPASKVSNRIRIAKRDLKHWIEDNRTTVPVDQTSHPLLSPARRTGKASRTFADAVRRARSEH
jgi:excisionase family DNA binding protein